MFVSHTETIKVPRGSGTEGYVTVVRDILKRPRVQEIRIGLSKVEYIQLLAQDDPFQPLKVNFEAVLPYALVRNSEVRELEVPMQNAAFAIACMFERVSSDRLVPLCFVGSFNSVVWDWHARSTGISLGTEELYGIPYYGDAHFEDATLLLCASSLRGGELIDIERAYKILMPERTGSPQLLHIEWAPTP